MRVDTIDNAVDDSIVNFVRRGLLVTLFVFLHIFRSIDVRGLYLGTETGLAAALNDAGLAPFVEKKSAKSRSVNWLDFVLEQGRETNCTRAKDANGLADRKLTNFGEDVSMNSFFVVPSNLLPASGYEDLFKWKASSKDAFVEIDVLGPKSKVAALSTPETAVR